jgi:hypothetical protein
MNLNEFDGIAQATKILPSLPNVFGLDFKDDTPRHGEVCNE